MARASHKQLEIAAARFGIDLESVRFVRDAANSIYEFNKDGHEYILRLTHGAVRSPEMITGEMEFIDYLAGNGGSAAQPLRSLAGSLVEPVVTAAESLYASVFTKVPGAHPTGEQLTPETIIHWGQALGRMHRLSKFFQPSRPETRRPHWFDMDIFQFARYLPADQMAVRAECLKVLEEVKALPTGPDSYGLVHGDAEPWNFLLHEGRITFIDFDDCCYHWFVFDLAVAYMYAIFASEQPFSPEFGQEVWRSLLTGYNTENRLDAHWFTHMPLFMRLRIAEDYAFSIRTWGADPDDEELRSFNAYQRRVLEERLPLLPIDFGIVHA